jgi:hypothetical protein
MSRPGIEPGLSAVHCKENWRQFRHKEGMTQDECLPGAEAISSQCAGFFHPYCGKVSMTVDFSISLKFLGRENFICTHMTFPYYPSSVVEDFTGNGLFPAFFFLYKLFSQVYPTIIFKSPYATLRAPPCFFLNMNYYEQKIQWKMCFKVY